MTKTVAPSSDARPRLIAQWKPGRVCAQALLYERTKGEFLLVERGPGEWFGSALALLETLTDDGRQIVGDECRIGEAA